MSHLSRYCRFILH